MKDSAYVNMLRYLFERWSKKIGKGGETMNKKLKKAVAVGVMSVSLLGVGTAVAHADTVYYKGSAVSWDHGRWMAAWSYSNVQSSSYEHVSTANQTSSGWQQPGVMAKAKQWVGTGQATAYWNCRG